MDNYFIPKLHPSQVVTAGEYLVAHGQIVSPMMEESLKESDYLLDSTERVKFALYASFSVEGNLSVVLSWSPPTTFFAVAPLTITWLVSRCPTRNVLALVMQKVCSQKSSLFTVGMLQSK